MHATTLDSSQDAARIDAIDALLPQTQCTQCGHDGCLPYARALAAGTEPINRCPPGGQTGVAALATLLHQAEIALDTTRGMPGPLLLARIDEAHCIGCTLCIKACPVDAIVGTNKRMHTVIDDLCSGCALCVAPCPVDCIEMVPAERDWTTEDADAARLRHRARGARLTHNHDEQERRLASRELHAPSADVDGSTTPVAATTSPDTEENAGRQAMLNRALELARQRRQTRQR